MNSTLKVLQILKKCIDNNITIWCKYSSTSRNPYFATIRYVDDQNNTILRARLHDFNITGLPEIQLDDVYELEEYIIKNYAALEKVLKLKAFI